MNSKFYLVSPDRIRRINVDQATKNAMRSDALQMVTFNVGNGETIILRRKARAILIDGGALVKKHNKELGNFLYNYLKNEGLKLKAIVASHPHTDHLNAVYTLLEEGGSQILASGAKYFDNGEVYPTGLSETLLKQLDDMQNHITTVSVDETGATLKVGSDVHITMFVNGRYKPKPAYKSIFMAVKFKNARLLFTGDAYIKYENELLNSSYADHLPAHVLKITHHGSSGGTGDNFVDHVKPKISIASTSPDSDHRLEDDVRERLKKYGKVYDTATVGGDIIVRTDGVTRELGNRKGILY